MDLRCEADVARRNHWEFRQKVAATFLARGGHCDRYACAMPAVDGRSDLGRLDARGRVVHLQVGLDDGDSKAGAFFALSALLGVIDDVLKKFARAFGIHSGSAVLDRNVNERSSIAGIGSSGDRDGAALMAKFDRIGEEVGEHHG